ncbi:MoaD/ThiS family protein [Jiangella alkaliphila]|uniref:Molybdopterin converting factor, small subunit n=1 Tax=Jiangella alkaliphila TaxID=419479 RepID=A0A1H2FV98_9ACTN|nr:MoaD/ThiS family protein [Jiangella alkaliphila]SDU11283.1 Molybdopterin converting factor, small subunit [Jiangella alkaliphila]
MAKVTLRYWAAIRAAAGIPAEVVDAGTLAEALAEARSAHRDSPRFAAVLDICAVVVDGTPAGSRDPATVVLREGAAIELLPPFAGGSSPLPFYSAAVRRPPTR